MRGGWRIGIFAGAWHSRYMSMRNWTQEAVNLYRLTSILPVNRVAKAARQHDAVLAADQSMVIRCLRDNLACFVYDVSHGDGPILDEMGSLSGAGGGGVSARSM